MTTKLENRIRLIRDFEELKQQRDELQAAHERQYRKVCKLEQQRGELLAALTWIRDVVKERKGTALWLQMVEDKSRNAIAKAEEGKPVEGIDYVSGGGRVQ